MRRRRWLAAVCCLPQIGTSMAEAKSDPFLWFRMKNGLVDVAHPPKPGPGLVRAQWPDAPAMLGVKVPAWTVDDDFFYLPNAQGAAHRYGARQGPHTRSVELFLSANGFAGAVDRLVELATNTMLPEPPFVKAPEALRFGELTLASTDPAHRTLIWTFRNLCVRVDTSAGGDETLALCRHLLGGLERRVVTPEVYEQARPRLVLPAGVLPIAPGERRRVVPTAPGTPPGWVLAAFPDSAAIAVLEQGLAGIVVQGLRPGLATLGVVLADPATLCCDAGVVRCQVG